MLVSIALAMIRIVIYDSKIESKNSWSEQTLRCKLSVLYQILKT